MQSFTMLPFVFSVLLSSFTHHADANNSVSLRADQKVNPTALLVFQDEPGHYFFVGRETEKGNVHVFEVTNNVWKERIQQPRSAVYYDGGSMDLYLDDGTRLYIPADHGGPTYLRESTGPAVTYTDRPRELLDRLEISESALVDLKLRGLVPDDFFSKTERSDEKRSKDAVFLANPQSASLVLLYVDQKDASGESVSGYEVKKSIEGIVEGLPKDQVKLMERGNELPFHVMTLVLGVDPAIRDQVLTELGKIEHIHVDTISSFENKTLPSLDFAQAGSVTSMTETLNSNAPLASRIAIIDALLDFGIQNINMTLAEKDALAEAVMNTLRTIDTAFGSVHEEAYYERRVDVVVPEEVSTRGFGGASNYIYETTLPQVPSHPLYQRFVEPLREGETKALRLLHELGTENSIRHVLLSAQAGGGAGLTLMGVELPNDLGTYLMEWIDWLHAAIDEASAIPDDVYAGNTEESGWMGSTHSGGIFEKLGVLGNQTFWRRTKDSATHHYDMQRIPPNPLVLLGLSENARVEKKQILQFIITAEAIVARQLERENAAASRTTGMRSMYPAVPNGNMVLTSVIRQLVWSAHSFPGFEPFSRQHYYSNVLDIFIELVETSAMTVKNDGTYHAVLDSALGLIESLEDSAEGYGTVVSEKAARLDKAIRKKLTTVFRYADGRDGSACAVLLSADPVKVWRAQR